MRQNLPLKSPLVARNQKGQLSIFLGISLLIVVTLMGFIVNVGLFVKAKINLQNSVDAAAYAGAAVQARQLTNIGYLNWEMRNNYKEWMYKYYVLGQLGLPDLRTQDDDGNSHFRLRPFNVEDGVNPEAYDRYNLPTICIHFGSESNICEIYQVPGLPRFDNVDVPFPGIVEHHKAFLNSIVATKSKDCSTRSALNQGTAMIWAYGTKNNAFANVPLVAGNRPGAWISSIEMAIRMRNLEAVVNRPAIPQPICINGTGCQVVSELQQETSQLPKNERPVKAFMSAYRNLSGGLEKEPSSSNPSNFASSLRLTEISPQPQEMPQGKLSTFLIPSGGDIGNGVPPTTKTYLDLQAVPLNLVTFFTTMVASSDSAQVPPDVTSEDLIAEGECAGTRTALPVPGFVFGFIKNPQVLTYYAVKAEADFVGLFYPFADQAGITLQAYAAAKPFGGRIGPRLFHLEENSMVMARAGDSLQFRSGPYISGLEVPEEDFRRGYPIPVNDSFWVTEPSMPIGGVPTSAEVQPRFSIPNLLYNYESFGHLDHHGKNDDSDQGIQIIELVNSKSAAKNNNSAEDLGLYRARQYNLLRDTSDLSTMIDGSSTIDADDIEKAIIRSRMPTKLEALNYMIPHMDLQFSSGPDDNLEQPAAIQPLGSALYPGEDIYTYDLYAPLSGDGTLYETGITAITTTLQEYLNANSRSIDTFIDSLEAVAVSMQDQSDEEDTQASYADAAEVIYRPSDITDPASGCTGDNDQLSMAGKFHIFFRENSESEICEVPSLVKSVTTYINNAASDNDRYNTYLRSEYAANPNLSNSNLMTGYMPGPRQGSDEQGRLLNPFTDRTDQLMARRNNYSTKFVSMASLTQGECTSEPFSYCFSYIEQPETGSGPTDFSDQEKVKNYVRQDAISDFLPLQF